MRSRFGHSRRRGSCSSRGRGRPLRRCCRWCPAPSLSRSGTGQGGCHSRGLHTCVSGGTGAYSRLLTRGRGCTCYKVEGCTGRLLSHTYCSRWGSLANSYKTRGAGMRGLRKDLQKGTLMRSRLHTGITGITVAPSPKQSARSVWGSPTAENLMQRQDVLLLRARRCGCSACWGGVPACRKTMHGR